MQGDQREHPEGPQREFCLGWQEYDILATQDKIRAAGLPDVLADRLAQGR